MELSYPVVSPVLTWPHFSLLGLNYINSLFQERYMKISVLLKLQSHDICVTNTMCPVFKVESVQRNLFFFRVIQDTVRHWSVGPCQVSCGHIVE